MKIFIIFLAIFLSGCAAIKNFSEKFNIEGKPIVQFTVADLESVGKRVENEGRTLNLKGSYKGIHKEFTTKEGPLIKDILITICDQGSCSKRFLLLGSQRSLLKKIKKGQYIEVMGYLAGINSGDSTTLVGNPNTVGIGLGRKGSYDHFWVLDIKPPTNDYSGGKSIPRETVKMVQKTLNALGHQAGIVDGLWGPKTSKALQAFQLENKLHYSGELDEKTHKLIKKKYAEIKSQ